MLCRDSIVWPRPREFSMRQKTISRFHPNDINFVNEDLFVVRLSRIVTCEKKCELDSRCYTEFGHVFAPPGDDRRTHKEPRVQEAQGPGRQPRRDQLPHPPRRHRLRDADENHRGDGRVLRGELPYMTSTKIWNFFPSLSLKYLLFDHKFIAFLDLPPSV